jgi:hypothetical protein
VSPSRMRYHILHHGQHIQFVEMPAAYAYQLTALHQRLHKEIVKLTADQIPDLPKAIAECDSLELVHPSYNVINGLAYMNQLESSFAAIRETSYPLISLLTEIRALQAQLEQWAEEELEES